VDDAELSVITYPKDSKGLDVSGVGHVRSSAKIDQGTATVDGAECAIGDTLVDEVLLVLAVLVISRRTKGCFSLMMEPDRVSRAFLSSSATT
jgi:hypothetical protein